MNRNEAAREAVVERIIAEARAGWPQLTPGQREQVLDRVCKNGGMFREKALSRIENPPCPHCGSTNVDRGETGLDACNVCGGLSRGGDTLQQSNRSQGAQDGGDPGAGC